MDLERQMHIYIYTRRKNGAKAPSLLDHLELRFPTFDAKAMDFQRRPQMLKPWIFEIRSQMLKPRMLDIQSGMLKPKSLEFDLRC